MIKFASPRPSVRANKIIQGVGDIINFRNNENLRQFGMRVSNEMAIVSFK